MKNSSRIYSVLTIGLIIIQLVVILLSWIVTAVMPRMRIYSLLNEGGIRWMFNSFTDSVMSPAVVWILIFSMVWGTYRGCGLSEISVHSLTFRKRLALRTIIVEALLATAIMLLLTVTPHAVLLSITGSLLTTEFFMGLIPTLAIFLLIIFITYGSITRSFTSVSSVLDSISRGISSTSRIWVPYILFMLVVHSLMYVFHNFI